MFNPLADVEDMIKMAVAFANDSSKLGGDERGIPAM